MSALYFSLSTSHCTVAGYPSRSTCIVYNGNLLSRRHLGGRTLFLSCFCPHPRVSFFDPPPCHEYGQQDKGWYRYPWKKEKRKRRRRVDSKVRGFGAGTVQFCFGWTRGGRNMDVWMDRRETSESKGIMEHNTPWRLGLFSNEMFLKQILAIFHVSYHVMYPWLMNAHHRQTAVCSSPTDTAETRCQLQHRCPDLSVSRMICCLPPFSCCELPRGLSR